MRQTGLSTKQITDHLNGACPQPYPRCLLVNELGEIAKNNESGGPSVEAQEALVTLLASNSEDERWIAAHCLKEVQNAGLATEDTNVYLGVFESKPENTGILS